MKKTLLIAAAFVALASCNKTLIETQVPESEYGYINLGITADTEMEVAATKADGTPTYKTAGDTYRVKLLNNSNTAVWSGNDVTDGWVSYSYLKSNASTLLAVPAGAYSIVAENIAETSIYNEDNKYGQMYVMGNSGSFAVIAGKSVDASVQCEIKNSKVIVKKGEGFETYFSDPTIQIIASISGKKETFDMHWFDSNTSSTNDNDEVYLPSGTSVVWKLTAVRKDTPTSTKRYTYTNEGNVNITTEEGKCTVITLTPSTNGNGAINVTITTNEYYTDISNNVVIDPIDDTVE